MTLEEVAENYGLTPEGVDYALKQYQIVLCEITHGVLSKLSYDAKDVIRIAQERWCDTCDLKEREEETETIRCEDCKFWRKNTEFCVLWSNVCLAQRVPPDWYCAGAEKR